MFDTSTQAAERGVAWLPAYDGRIRAVGDLRADELLAASRDAELTRRALGVPAGRRLIAVMSTWGMHGLIPKFGRELLSTARQLANQGEHSFVFTMHHNLWDASRAGTSDWANLLREHQGPNLHVVGPGEDYTRYLAASDAAVSDHTSLAMIYSVLERPIIPVSVPREILVPGSFSDWLMSHRATVGSGDELRRALANPKDYDLEGAPRVIDFVGECRSRTRAAILDVLESTQRG
jgi:CDP-glycerol glycerophosphotransferase (TagB/SpsB family)